MMTILTGDAIEQLRTLPDESVQCCVTSPPYWGLRDYKTDGQLGLEKTPEEYVAKMVEVFREVRRVLRKDGTLWLNLGDSYASDFKGSGGASEKQLSNAGSRFNGSRFEHGLKPKDLCGIPWRVAFALQADGWWLRSDIIWAKPNPMPESVTDRPTKSHEYLFLLTKSANYFYDAEAIKEPSTEFNWESRLERESIKSAPTAERNGTRTRHTDKQRGHGRRHSGFNDRWDAMEKSGQCSGLRNKRSVWTVATAPYPEAHFATYPPDLIKPCIMAGTSARGCCASCGAPWERVVERSSYERNHTDPKKLGTLEHHQSRGSGGNEGMIRSGAAWNEFKDENPDKTLGWQPTCKHSLGGDVSPCTVLDPFAGSGTTGAVALELGRKALLIELNPKYVELIRQRCDVTPGLALA